MDPYFTEVTVDNLHGSHGEDLKGAANIYNFLHNMRVQAYCKDHPGGSYRSPSLAPTEPGVDCDSFLKRTRASDQRRGDIATISTCHKALSQRLAKRAALTQDSARSTSYVQSPRC